MAVLQKQHLSGHAAKGKKLGPPKLKKSWEVIADAGDATYNMLSAKKYRVRVCGLRWVALGWVGPRATRCAACLTCCHPSGCDGCSGRAGVGVPPIASAVGHAAVHLRENHEPIAQAPPAVTPWPRPWRLRPVVGRTGPVVPCHRRRSAQPQGSRTQPCRAPPLCRIATQR